MSLPPDPNLERQIHGELRKLPDITAPAALIPAVLRAIEARARRYWYQRPWLAWPPLLQAGALLIFVSATVAIFWVVAAPASPTLMTAEERLNDQIASIGGSYQYLNTIGNALLVTVRVAHPWLGIFATLLAAVCVICMGAGILCLRMLYPKRL
jgi:hypothetical protein